MWGAKAKKSSGSEGVVREYIESKSFREKASGLILQGFKPREREERETCTKSSRREKASGLTTREREREKKEEKKERRKEKGRNEPEERKRAKAQPDPEKHLISEELSDHNPFQRQ